MSDGRGPRKGARVIRHDGERWIDEDAESVTTIVEAVAELGRHPYDNACPFGCDAPAEPYDFSLPHTDDCPITLARRATAGVITERRSPSAPPPQVRRMET